jgi:ribonuclease M5
MKKINAVLVVEGKSDVQYLSNFIDCEFVITNGSEIPFETVEYLKTIIKTKDVVVLTDPDSPGKRIRDVLDQNIDGLKHCFIRKEFAVKHGKVGVAECDIDEVLNALDDIKVFDSMAVADVTSSDLFDLGLTGQPDSAEKRYYISTKLGLGYTNAKTFCRRLNSLHVSKEEMIELLHEQK